MNFFKCIIAIIFCWTTAISQAQIATDSITEWRCSYNLTAFETYYDEKRLFFLEGKNKDKDRKLLICFIKFILKSRKYNIKSLFLQNYLYIKKVYGKI